MKLLGTLLGAFLIILFSGLTAASADNSGSWVGVHGCSWGSGKLTLQVDANGNVTGKGANVKIKSGHIAGSSISFSGSNWMGNRSTWQGSVYNGSMSGTYTQQASSETCPWSATLVGGKPQVKIGDWDDRPDKERKQIPANKRQKALLQDANLVMQAAYAAAQYCTYADQMKASERYFEAGRLFEQAGDPRKKALAEKLGYAASDRADECEKAKKHRKSRSDRDRNNHGDDRKNPCEEGKNYADSLQQNGEKAAAKTIRKALRSKGCDAPDPPDPPE